MQNTTLNGYTLRRLLGKGGMAEVWYAENRLGKPAAVKIMLAHLLTLPSVVERFEIEAKAMVRLDHPNIRQVFDYGEWQGRPFIVMEYLEGQTLSDVISNKKNVTDVTYLGWWQSCLDALQHTHSKNIIHRDIKPSNIFLCNDGTLKLLDFGIAKVKDEISHTQTGQGLGTKVYMSPEQITDPKRVTTATDVYSLAVTFVHLLRKQTPFADTDSDYKLFDQIVKGQINLQGISAEWLKRLKPCLTTTSNQRLTAEQCLEKSTESTKKGDKTEIIPTPPNEKEKKAKTGDLLKPVYAPSPLEKYLPWGLAVAALAIVLWVILKPDPEIDLIPANQKVDYYTRQQKPKPSVTTSSPQQQVNQAPQQQVIDSDAAPKEKFLKGIKMIKIPGKNFYMGETEVTIGEYLQFCKATNGNYPEWLELGNQYNIYSGSDDSYRKAGMSESNTRNPVTGISWNDAVAFCQWAGGRLPTEEEWEYSANGGQNFEYAGSNNIDEVAWHSGNSGGRSHSVKGKKPNSFGLFDMIGNVWEWTSTSDGSGRVLRGGYWDYHAVLRGTAIRLSYPPGLRDVCLGFRLVSPH